MKKILKTYTPIVISVLFTFCYTYMISNIINNYNQLNYNNEFYIIMVVISILLVLFTISILVEMITFIIHAIKHKEIKNNIVWVILIYFLNIFIIPFYNLKYVVNDAKYKLKTIIYSILMVLSICLGIIVNNYIIDKNINNIEYNTYISDDKIFSFSLPNSYIERNVGEYDAYFSDKARQINMGVFIYNLDNYTAEEILTYQENYIIETRTDVELIDSNTKYLSDKKIISHDYTGIIEDTKNNYKLSIISFNDNPNYALYIVQITLSENYDNVNEELNQILHDIKLNDTYNEL